MGTNSTQGTLLKVSSTTIAQRVRIKPAEHTRADIETTDLDSTWKTYIAGIPDGGEMELEINYDPGSATHATLWSLFGSGAVDDFQLVLTDAGAAVISFDAIVKGFMLGEMTTDQLQRATVKLRITGAVAIAP